MRGEGVITIIAIVGRREKGEIGGNICVIRWPKLHYTFVIIEQKKLYTWGVYFIKGKIIELETNIEMVNRVNWKFST